MELNKKVVYTTLLSIPLAISVAVNSIPKKDIGDMQEVVIKENKELEELEEKYESIKKEIKDIEAKTDNIIAFYHTKILNERDIDKYNKQFEINRSASINRTNLYNLDLRMNSNLTSQQIDIILKGTSMEGLGESFIKAEKTYGVNALFLTTLAMHESDSGRSRIARDKKNLFGYGAYDETPYESAVTFKTYEAGILRVARHIAEEYINPKGKYFSGYTIKDVNNRYASDKEWHNKIIRIMEKNYNKILRN